MYEQLVEIRNVLCYVENTKRCLDAGKTDNAKMMLDLMAERLKIALEEIKNDAKRDFERSNDLLLAFFSENKEQ